MLKKFLFVLFTIMFLASISATTLGTYKQGSCVELLQSCADCSYVNFTRVTYPNATRALGNVQAQKEGSLFNYTFCNTDSTGTYIVEGIGDVEGTDTVFMYDFEVTYNGRDDSIWIYFILIFLFSSIIVGYYYIDANINYEKWYTSMLNRYKFRNYFKFIGSMIIYNIVKNKFGVFYILGLPLVISIVSMIINFNIEILILFAEIFMYIYAWGVLLVGLMIGGQLQEFIARIVEDIKNLEWGFEK